MKKMIVCILLIAALALTACARTSPAAETTPSEKSVGIANPWREVTEAEAKELCPGSLRAPEGAENARWSVMETAGESALVQLDFDLNGMSFTAREQLNNDKAADIAGMYYPWTVQTDMTLQNWEESARAGVCCRYIGEDEWADLCTWYDTAKGISYSLGVTAKDLDGFDLQAVAEALAEPAEGPAAVAVSEREDGERFETVVVIEGMEETVRYEHVRNDALGFEMDYDYELFTRLAEEDCERFVSVWDNVDRPENYLEVSYSGIEADAAAADLRMILSEEYDLLESTRELERAGSCVYIEAAVVKGTNMMADQLQAVYIIPTSDGCLIAEAHFSAEAAEGFGRRFNYMVNTISIL